ncbi:hypothetical protein SD427_01000 [Chryseobacterium sp. JJR-5R]|nr:hypothetical protein [Chryseobacterium sp. JJR-5R]WPO82950.1 hypothetical protein SD427_01000 [Chryseobacterium sp. JJR-5R]
MKKLNIILIANAIKIKNGNFSQKPNNPFKGDRKDILQNSESIFCLKNKL